MSEQRIENIKEVVQVYSVALVILIGGGIALGLIAGAALGSANSVASADVNGQFPSAVRTMIWVGITILCAGAALYVSEMLSRRPVYAWLWPVVATSVFIAANTLSGNPLLTELDVYGIVVSVAALCFAQLRVDKSSCAKSHWKSRGMAWAK